MASTAAALVVVVLSLLLSLTLVAVAADNASPAKTSAATIGINYGRLGNDLPTPSKVVSLLKSVGVTSAKIYDTDSTVLSAFSKSGISLIVNLPNEFLSKAAASTSYTDSWLKSNIVPFHPSTSISAIAVGNEVLSSNDNSTIASLLPAMTNLYLSLRKLNLHNSIKLSSPLALSALSNSYPPSAGAFKPDLVNPVIKPMLQFLRNTSSYLMINAYPFLAYSSNSDVIPIDYALFRPNATPVVDSNTGLTYTSLFDAQVDAVYAAMKSLRYDDVQVVVTETGWPSKGDDDEAGASLANAKTFNNNLIKRVFGGKGTPLKPDRPLVVYLFALFNENQKTGPTSERNFGLFYPNEERVYDLPLTQTQLTSGGGDTGAPAAAADAPASAPAAAAASDAPVSAPAAAAQVSKAEVSTTTAAAAGETWCVASGSAGREKLQAALDYACGEGEADCRPIQRGAACHDPDTLEAHASYAFNSYYQMKSRGAGTCAFGGTAHVVTQPPKYGNCEFPTRY